MKPQNWWAKEKKKQKEWKTESQWSCYHQPWGKSISNFLRFLLEICYATMRTYVFQSICFCIILQVENKLWQNFEKIQLLQQMYLNSCHKQQLLMELQHWYLKSSETLPSVTAKVRPLPTYATIHPIPCCATVEHSYTSNVSKNWSNIKY